MRSAKALRQRGLVCLRRGTFHRRKVPKMRRGLRPPDSLGPRGVHPKERHCLSCYAPPGYPVPYCLPLPGFARASRIGQLLRLQNFSQRPHPLPRNGARRCTRQLLRTNITVHAVGARIERPCRTAASRGGCSGLTWPFVPPQLRCCRRGGLDGRPEPPASCDSLPETHPGHGRPYRPPLR